MVQRPFSLVKWYLDCLDEDGRAIVGYWVEAAWQQVSITWESVDLYREPLPPVHRWSLRRSTPPQAGAGLCWNAPALGCTATIERRQPPFTARLLEDADGTVDWAVEAPVGRVTVKLDGEGTVLGQGYVERLAMTVAPWRLPITTLRWGRWGSAGCARSLVWIDWRGPDPRSWVFLDGRLQPRATVSDSTVGGDGFTLDLEPRQRLTHRRLDALVQHVPGLKSVLPESLLALSETKWAGTGRLSAPGGHPMTAPALYEIVHMG